MTAIEMVAGRQGFLKIFVADLERSAAFYAQALGCQVGGRMAAPDFDELLLRTGLGQSGGTIVLCRWRDGRDLVLGNASGPIGFLVEDVDLAHGRIVDAGGVSRVPPTSLGAARLAIVEDLDGHALELLRLNAPA